MPIEFDIWRVDGGQLTRVVPSRLAAEATLETIIERDVSVLGLNVMVIGRQVLTSFGNRIDLVALDAQGYLCVVEVKRDRTPREVVAQLLDYGSWVSGLNNEAIAAIYSAYAPGQPLEQAFAERFGDNLPETLNEQHRLIVVASELDHSTERIVTYLSTQYGVPINAVFFRYLEDDSRQYLARTWLVERSEGKDLFRKSSSRLRAGTWNGQDFYVSLGGGEHRAWGDCRKYGFVSGGNGPWYSRTLRLLFPGARVFACVPNRGYVGVGIVREPLRRVTDFTVAIDGATIPILQAPLQAPNMGGNADDPALCEYLVRVEWLTTLPTERAIWEKGMFANQNTVCRLSDKFTLDRLVERFGLTE